MAENLNLQGTVDIDVSGAVRNLEQLADAGLKVADSLGGDSSLEGLQAIIANASKEAISLRDRLTEVAMLDMADLGIALSLEREVGLAGEWSNILQRATGHMQEHHKAALEVEGAQRQLLELAEKRAAAEKAVQDSQKGMHGKAYKELEDSLNKQVELQYRLNRVRDLGGENAAKFSKEMVAQQEAEAKAIEEALEAEKKLNYETAQRLGIDLTPLTKAKQDELEATYRLVELEERYARLKAGTRAEDAGRVHDIERAHAAAVKLNQELAKADQDKAFATYGPNIQATRERIRLTQEEERQYNKLANTRYALQDLAFTWTAISAATTGAATAAIKVAADYDQAFKSVERTTLTVGDAAAQLKAELVDLTTVIPQQFDAISNIATLGAQMDVATEDLGKFTETVAMFSSTTDVSVDKASMSFGRLAQLTETPIDSIDRLASSVYHVGINSVATEGQILSIAEQIAVSGNLAGFANHEIIGLSAALASLGVQPEAARGAVMRIFNVIRQGVEEGGDALQQFAAVSGTSADNFAQAWLNRPQEAFNMFVEGLSRVADEGGSVSLVLKEMGLSNVRDLRVLELLADNTEVYADALADAAGSYGDNTALAEGYATQVDNLNDQITLLVNSLKGMLSETGLDQELKELVKTLLNISEALRSVLQNPVAAMFAKMVVAAVAAVGAYSAYQAITTRATASTMGLIQSMRGMRDSVGLVTPGLRGLIDALRSVNREQREMSRAARDSNQALREQRGAATGAATGVRTVGTAGKGAATGMGAATAAVRTFAKATVVMAAISLAFEGLSRAINAVSYSLKDASGKFSEAIGGFGGLQEAIKADTAAWRETGEGMRVVGTTLEDLQEKYGETTEAQAEFRDGVAGAAHIIEEGNTVIDQQTIALGKNAEAWLANALNTSLFSELSIDAIRSLKGDVSTLGGIIKDIMYDAAHGTNTAQKSIADFQTEITNGIAEQEAARDALMESHNNELAAQEELRIATMEMTWLREEDANAAREQLAAMEEGNASRAQQIWAMQQSIAADKEKLDAVNELINGSEALREQVETEQIMSEIAKIVGQDFVDATDDMVDGLDEATDALKNFESEVLNMVNSAIGIEEALERVGASLFENGLEFDYFSEAGRANIEAVQGAMRAFATDAGDDVELLTVNLILMLEALEGQGVDTVNELDFVYQYLQELTGNTYGVDLSTAAARQNLLNLLNDGQAVKNLLAELGAVNAQLQGAQSWGAAMAYHDQKVELEKQIQAVEDLGKRITSVRDEQAKTGRSADAAIGRGMTNAYNKARDAARGAGGAGKKAGKDAADSAKKAQKEIRTLADYVSDLSTVMSRSFEFRFGVQSSRDATADLWANIRKSAEDARDAVTKALQDIMDADAKLKGLKADKQVLQYQLTVAEEYGDTLRAAQIRAELADTNAEIAKTEKDKADAQKAAKAAQDATNKSLVGNSAAARKNRADILDLVQSYQKQVEALADSGLSTKQLQRETEKLRQDFVRQATQAGYSKSEIEKYTKSFRDMSTVIAKVPRKITVNANVAPAQRAINEFLAKKQKAAKVPSRTTSPSKGNLNNVKRAIERGIRPSTIRPTVGNPTGNDITRVRNWIINQLNKGLKIKPTLSSGGGGKFTPYWTGGFTGRGSKYEEAGIVHKGEYVVPSQFVNQSTGLPDMNALGQSLGMNTYSSSVSSVTNTTTVAVVELSARDRQLLQQMGNPQIVMDGRVVATTTNRNNLNTSRRGVG